MSHTYTHVTVNSRVQVTVTVGCLPPTQGRQLEQRRLGGQRQSGAAGTHNIQEAVEEAAASRIPVRGPASESRSSHGIARAHDQAQHTTHNTQHTTHNTQHTTPCHNLPVNKCRYTELKHTRTWDVQVIRRCALRHNRQQSIVRPRQLESKSTYSFGIRSLEWGALLGAEASPTSNGFVAPGSIV